MSVGPLMIDIEGCTLSHEDRDILQHPLVGGVILFTRNYESIEQLTRLTTDIHALRQPSLLIAVDHEGGRVQRFRQHFVHLPPCAKLGELYDSHSQQALTLSEQMGWLMGAELRSVGIDFSFAPILDLGGGLSTVIGDRAFHAKPEVVAELARAMMVGMHQAGMIAVGKHFPGHGTVAADSHIDVPVDERHFVDLQFKDLLPFERMIHYGLSAIMPAHVIYPQIDTQPAVFSEHWLQGILRQKLNFQGVIFSDDLSMAGAAVMGDALARMRQALQAGCDMVLVCNHREDVIYILDHFGKYNLPRSQARLIRLHRRAVPNWDNLQDTDWDNLHATEKWSQVAQALSF
ncbi:MAG: beta-N-acetylhexosaminidase [Thiomargarita sp.]|nr:beta-N-acetylhexosaminidase [Thiomargarita sp.]